MVYVDVPLSNTAALAVVERMGLQVQRHLLRMGRGPAIQENMAALWASSGPEKG